MAIKDNRIISIRNLIRNAHQFILIAVDLSMTKLNSYRSLSIYHTINYIREPTKIRKMSNIFGDFMGVYNQGTADKHPPGTNNLLHCRFKYYFSLFCAYPHWTTMQRNLIVSQNTLQSYPSADFLAPFFWSVFGKFLFQIHKTMFIF